MRAATKGFTKIVELLLQYGADVNVKSLQGMTPLMFAAKNGDIEMVKLLLENEADVNVVNAFGETAKDVAKKSNFAAIADLI